MRSYHLAYFFFLLICHSAYSGANNPDPKRFLDSFKTFKKLDQQKDSTTNKITLFTGSSSIRMWESLEDDFPEINLINRGFGGSHLSDVIFFYERLFPNYKPVQIVLYCGENDLWSGKSVNQVFADFKLLWRKIKIDLPESKIYYLSCKPSPKRISKWNIYQSLNLRIKNLSLRNSNLTYIDISPTLLKPDMTFYLGLWKNDNLHLNQNGYVKWTKWIRSFIK
jgi:hypothetical protein